MDNYLNNEALAAYVAMYILSHERFCPFAKMAVVMVLVMDDGTRKLLKNKSELPIEQLLVSIGNATLINNIYQAMLPTCLNSATLLADCGLVNCESDWMALTEKGYMAVEEISTIESDRLHEIVNAVFPLLEKLIDLNEVDLYKSLKLTL